MDARWLMAYGTALGEPDERGHPLFPVCYEWPATRALRESTGQQKLNAQLVHAQHDLVIHRKSGLEALATEAQVVSARQRSPGAYIVIRISARDVAGNAVTTSDYGMLYRGVELEGPARSIAATEDPPVPGAPLVPAGEFAVAANAAHAYSESARIWNPIHTDVAYARAAGLPGIILHGTATLALSVSSVVRKFNVDPSTVRRVQCRFSGMVTMPSTLAVFALPAEKKLFFETHNPGGEAVITRGCLLLQ